VRRTYHLNAVTSIAKKPSTRSPSRSAAACRPCSGREPRPALCSRRRRRVNGSPDARGARARGDRRRTPTMRRSTPRGSGEWRPIAGMPGPWPRPPHVRSVAG